MRILKFLGATLGALIVVFFVAFGFNLNALFTLFENSGDLQEGQEWASKTSSLKGLTEYIPEHSERVSLVSSSLENPDTTIAFSAEQPRTMGALSNLFIITTYARLIDEHQIDPEKRIAVSEIDDYQLPYIDASNHQNAMEGLRDRDLIENGHAALKDLVNASVEFNDLAISDYLYYEFGPETIRETYRQLNIEQTELPLPFTGLYITLHPDLHDVTFSEHFEQLQTFSSESFRDSVLEAADRFKNNEEFHNKVISLFEENQGLGIGFSERRDILTFFPKTTAAEMSRLMVRLQDDKLISPKVSEQVRTIMSWPLNRLSISNELEQYGAIYDNRLGLVSGIDFGKSTFSEEPFGQALFFDSLQVAFWFHMSSNLIHQDFQQRLMWDPALRETTQWEINK